MAKYCFGVDVGGTTVKLGCFDTEGTLLEKWEITTRTANGGEAILPDVAASILDKMKEREISREDVIGVGVGAPGPIDGEGTVYNAVNPVSYTHLAGVCAVFRLSGRLFGRAFLMGITSVPILLRAEEIQILPGDAAFAAAPPVIAVRSVGSVSCRGCVSFPC